jgi:E1A/CREB-binding protein
MIFLAKNVIQKINLYFSIKNFLTMIKNIQMEQSVKGTNNSSSSSSSCTSTSTEQKQQRQLQPIERPREDDKHELRTHLLPIWQKLWDSEPECPGKKQLDMQMKAIRLKLKKGEFKNAWEYCEQMWQMFENVWLHKKSYTQVI